MGTIGESSCLQRKTATAKQASSKGRQQDARQGGAAHCQAAWTEEEVARLEQTLREYPKDRYSIVAQCTKAAAVLPRKSVREVAARVRATPSRGSSVEDDEFARRVDQLLRANVDVIGRMRDNLHKIELMDNIPLMREFDQNVAAAFSLLRRLDAKMPPFPVRVNTMFLAAGRGSSNESADAFSDNASREARPRPTHRGHPRHHSARVPVHHAAPERGGVPGHQAARGHAARGRDAVLPGCGRPRHPRSTKETPRSPDQQPT